MSCMQPARRRSNPKLMLDEEEADESIDEADPEDDVDPDADVDVEPTAELDDDLDLDSIINAAVPPTSRSPAGIVACMFWTGSHVQAAACVVLASAAVTALCKSIIHHMHC